MTVLHRINQCSLNSHSIHSIQRFSSKTDITNNSSLSNIPHSTNHERRPSLCTGTRGHIHPSTFLDKCITFGFTLLAYITS